VTIPAGVRLGPYEIRGPLGEGGMGEVYDAWDPRLRRSVALKVLPDGVVADPDRRQRFEREALAIAALSHPNIVTIYAVDEHEGRPMLAMEKVDGLHAAAELAWFGAMSLATVMPVSNSRVVLPLDIVRQQRESPAA
jgi:serine/threonine-protein kinase